VVSGDQAQRARRIGEGERSPTSGCAAVGQEGLGKTGLRRDLGQAGGIAPLVLNDHRHRITALGDLDGRRQQVGKGQAAVAPVQATQPPPRRAR
jgi:hypothetical protein